MVEYIQRDENQAGPHIRADVKGKTRGKNNQTRHKSDKSIQNGDAYGFSQQGMAFVNIASEYGHGADSQAQGKESLIHGGCNRFENPNIPHPLYVREKIKLRPLYASGKGHAAHGKNHNNKQKHHHHYFGNAFNALLQAEGADQDPGNDHDYHNGHQNRRTVQHTLKHGRLPALYPSR